MKRILSIILALILLLTMGSAFASGGTTSDDHKHNWKEIDRIKEPTCTETGLTYDACTICQKTRERVIPAKGHHFPKDGWKTTKEPTCTDAGQEKNYCTNVNYGRVCGYEWRRDIPALGHDWSDWYVIKEAKPGEPGIKERKCKRCGITEQQPYYVGEEEATIFLNAYIPSPQPSYGEGEKIPYVLEVTNNSDMPLFLQWIYFQMPNGVNGFVSSAYHVNIGAHETLYFYDFTLEVTKADLEASYAPEYTVNFEAVAFVSESDMNDYTKKVPNNGKVYVTAYIGDEAPEEMGLEVEGILDSPQPVYYQDDPVLIDVKITNTGSTPLVVDYLFIENPDGTTSYVHDPFGGSVIPPSGYLNANHYTNPVIAYHITPGDCSEGHVKFLISAQGHNPETEKEVTSNVDSLVVDTEYKEKYDVEIIKEVISEPEGAFYVEGEEIAFEITVKNNGDDPIYNVRVVERPQDEDELAYVIDNIAFLDAHDILPPYTVIHKVTKDDMDAGDYTNGAAVVWDDQPSGTTDDLTGGYLEADPVTVICAEEIGDMEIDILKEEVGGPANGSYYTEDEEVEFKITVWNCQGYPLYNVRIWELPQDEPNLQLAYYEEFGPHQTVSFTVKHTVTAQNCTDGSYENKAGVYWVSSNDEPAEDEEDDGDNYMESTCTVDCGGGEPAVYIYKQVISDADNHTYYTEGEEIQYKITVKNKSGKTLHGFVLHDTNAADEMLNPPGGYGDLNPDQVITLTYSHKVTYEDAVLYGEVINTAFGTWWDDNGDPDSKYSETVITPCGGEPKAEVTLVKKEVSTPADTVADAYDVNEIVIYEITITNNSDVPVEDVEIVDPIKGNNEDAIVDIIPILGPHETLTYLYQYVIKPEDKTPPYMVQNQARATYVTGDQYVTITSNVVVVNVIQDPPPPPDEYPDVELIKAENDTPDNGSFYQENEQITYNLTFVNNNDYPLYNVSIYDDLYSESNPIATISVLGPHETYGPVSFDYTVKGTDVLPPYCITNQAYAEYFLEVGDEDWGVYSNVVVVPTGVKEPDPVDIDYTFTKTVANLPSKGYYAEYETVAYLITLVNNSDYPLYFGDIWDELYNCTTYISGNIPGSGGVCPPHDSVTIPYSYTVTHQDVVEGYITNYAEISITVADPVAGTIAELWDYDIVTVLTGEGPDEREYPAVVKYVVSDPVTGPYKENEVIEYDIYVYNYTEREFRDLKAYDILCTDTGFFVQNLGDLKPNEWTKFHVKYTVQAADIGFDIYNIAWVTMYDLRYQEEVTIYSNEVLTPTVGEPPEKETRTVCEYKLAATGDGADEYMNVYCTEHENVHAAVAKLLSQADTDVKKEKAYEMGLNLWQRALDSEYERLIKAADGELKKALEDDHIAFNAYIGAYRSRLEAEGKSTAEVFDIIADAINDRVCELCYTQGHAPEARTDLHSAETSAISRRSGAVCTFKFDDSEEKYFTKSLNVCDKHVPLQNAINRLFSTAGEDEAMLAVAWDKTAAFWKSDLDGKYNAASASADPMLKHYLTYERTAFFAAVNTRTALYKAYYPDDALIAAELNAQMVKEKALSLCK